mgnify:CR=1 FL=1
MKKFNIKEWQTKHLNEAAKANWRTDVEEPFSNSEEKSAAHMFEIKANPITIISVDGFISEEETELTIQFSNKDKMDYYYKYGASMGGSGDPNQKCTIYMKGNKIDVDKYELKNILGSTGTIVGDLGTLYTDYYKANQ